MILFTALTLTIFLPENIIIVNKQIYKTLIILFLINIIFFEKKTNNYLKKIFSNKKLLFLCSKIFIVIIPK